MFLRFTKKFSRPKLGFIIALLMLFAPVLIATTVESAEKKNAKAVAPSQKKKATPAPKKTAQAKTKPTPKKTPATASKSKTTTKKSTQAASKNKTTPKKNEKNTSSKTNQKTTDKNKNSKTANTKNSKQILTATNKKSSKNKRNEKSAKTTSSKNISSKTTNSKTAEKNKIKPTTIKKSRPTTAKTTTRRTPPITIDTKPNTNNSPETTSAEFPQIIVTTFSVPVRSQAKPDAPMLSNVKLGTVLRVTEKNPAWYKVQYSAEGKTSSGWISANSVNDLNASGKAEIYRQIVERNYKPQMDFASATEIYEFLSNVDGELDSSDKSADMELKRLLALRSAVKTIPIDKKDASPYREFLKSQENALVYSEPSGEWLVVSNRFWDLHTKYKKSLVSDTIAWEAANNPLPGECEGYVNCYLFDMRMRFGEYLNLHPNGKNSAEALRNVTDYLSPIVADSQPKKIYNGPTDVTDRAEFNNLIAELRTIMARLQFVEKEKVLQQLRQIAEAYR